MKFRELLEAYMKANNVTFDESVVEALEAFYNAGTIKGQAKALTAEDLKEYFTKNPNVYRFTFQTGNYFYRTWDFHRGDGVYQDNYEKGFTEAIHHIKESIK